MARSPLALVGCLLPLLACSKSAAEAETQPPAADEAAPEPSDENTFVSTNNNEDLDEEEPEPQAGPLGDLQIQEATAARELAEEAVADQLNPRQTWKTSPALPVQWPPEEKAVMFFFYPMAASPNSMSHFQLFSAAFRVDVSLEDGSTQVKPISGRRKLGTVEDKRPSVLERKEMDLAEHSLLNVIAGGTNPDEGENNFWGYLKYWHEHPKFARDMKKRVPRFAAWLDKKR